MMFAVAWQRSAGELRENMQKTGLLSLLICTAAMVVSSWGFNIDAVNPTIYTGEKNDSFGYEVLQFISDKERGVMVSAPLQRNGSGGICKCVDNRTRCFHPPAISLPTEEGSVKYIGLSLADDSTNPPEFIACSPGLAHECHENSYLNSVCYQFNSHFNVTSNFTPDFQECTSKKVDLVFLFDGSYSMEPDEFQQNKDFIWNTMEQFNNSSFQFAAVQFSTYPSKVFDFNDYQQKTAFDKLKEERLIKDLTNTYKAMDFVLKSIFDDPSSGANPNATQVMVIITDGNPSDTDKKYKSISASEERQIIRFVIGVGDEDYNKSLTLASDKNNTFTIENYDGLSGILDNFQKRIFNIEGTKTRLGGNLKKEMSQSGFSALFQKDRLVLGSVGSYEGRGSLYESRRPGSEQREMQDPTVEQYSYIGYSLAIGKKNGNPDLVYFTGAPRSEHRGKVVLFRSSEETWNVTQRLSGEQIGSYFGAVLCSVDVDSDNNTDFLLVGAPTFHQPKSEGRIYVYTLTDKLELQPVVNVSGPSWGRFGSSIASLADLNGDGLRDVAVGAPLEDGRRGAVYIYLGDALTGIRPQYSQRLGAERMPPGLQFFGQALDGRVDLDEDGLTDIVVGAQGGVVILRSKPVLNVTVHPSSRPSEINADLFDCSDPTPANFTLTVCFRMKEATKSKYGALAGGIGISYTLEVDPLRPIYRAFFSKTDRKAKTLHTAVTLRRNETCFDHLVYMTQCVQDRLSAVQIKLNFNSTQLENQTETPSAVLNADTDTDAVIEVPFTKRCTQHNENNDTCVAELEVDLNFITTTKTLLVVEQGYFRVTVRLSNHANDSYNTNLTLHYPPGLSFSTMQLEQATRPIVHVCDDLKGVVDRTVCWISRPVFRSHTTATFGVQFSVNASYEWNDTITMMVIAQSENDNSTNAAMNKSIPVQFEVDVAVKALAEESITQTTFTLGDKRPKKLVHIYEVMNLAAKSLPVTAILTFPTLHEHEFKMSGYQVSVSQNQTECVSTTDVITDYCTREKQCKSIKCETLTLDKYSKVHFTLSGYVAFGDIDQYVKDMSLLQKFKGAVEDVAFKSFANINYDKERYVQKSSQRGSMGDVDFHEAQITVRAEFVIAPDEQLIIGTGVGGGLFLLVIITVGMFKMGCFKRKKRMDSDGEERNSERFIEEDPQDSPGDILTGEPEGKQAEPGSGGGTVEEKPLLHNGKDDNDGAPVNKAEDSLGSEDGE